MTNRVTNFVGVPFTEFANFTFTEQVNTASKLRPGAVCAGCIDFDLFTDGGESITAGDVLRYYQVDENDNATLIGSYFAETVIPSRMKQHITAYDNIIKLESDFSRKLAQLQNSFPMPLQMLVQEACDVAGVTLATPTFPLYDIQVKQFYTDSISCRQIISWAAEVACRFVRCNANGEIVFDWYVEVDDYRIYPTSGTSQDNETYVYYQMNGLEYSGETSASVDYVKIRLNQDDANGYVYPSSYSGTYAVDTTGNGNLQLYHFTAIDNGDASYGNIYLQDSDVYSLDTSGDGNVSVLEEETNINCYLITDNLLLTDASDATLYRVAKQLYDTLDAMPPFRECGVELFPFFNPFRAGQIAKVTDARGTSFVFPIMKMEQGKGTAKLVAQNGLAYNAKNMSSYAETAASLSATVLQLQKLIVDQLQAVDAEIENLWTRDLTVSGILHSDDYVYRDGNIYATSGTGLDFEHQVLRTPNFAVQGGRLYARLGMVGNFNLAIGSRVTDFTPPFEFFDTNDEASTDYTFVDNVFTAGENGTIVFTVQPTEESRGIVYQIAKFWMQVFSGGVTPSAGWSTPSATVEYYNGNGTLINSAVWSALNYQPVGSILGSNFTFNQDYIDPDGFIKVRLRLTDSDNVNVQVQYGSYSALYTTSTRMAGAPDNVYLGSDGISVGEDIILTPDGHGHFGELSANKAYVKNYEVPITIRGREYISADETVIYYGHSFATTPNVILTPYVLSGVDQIIECYPTSVAGNQMTIRCRIFDGSTWSTPNNLLVRWTVIGD